MPFKLDYYGFNSNNLSLALNSIWDTSDPKPSYMTLKSLIYTCGKLSLGEWVC